jgi:hypothetical protein
LVLCYLEGLSHEEAAGRLGWPLGTVRSRLARGRERLRARLSRRGLAPVVGLLPLAWEESVSAAQVRLTACAAIQFARIGILAEGIPTAVGVLTQEVLRIMFMTRLQAVARLFLAAGILVAGAGVLAQKPDDPARPKPARAARQSVVQESASNKSGTFYYVVLGEVPAPGRRPVTGNETVLDAINESGGLLAGASIDHVRLIRPSSPRTGRPRVLPVHLKKILQGDVSTNYQLLPGDRLYVNRDPDVVDRDATTAELARRLRETEWKLEQVLQMLEVQDTTPFKSMLREAPRKEQ